MSLAGFTAIIGIWLAAGWLRLVDPLFVPALPAVVRSLVRLTRNGALEHDTVATLWRVSAAFLIAAAIGIPLGIVVGSIAPLRRAVEPVLDFFRSVPGTALFPLFLIFFGAGDRAKVANAVFAATLIIAVAAMAGVLTQNRTRVAAAQTLGASRMRIWLHVVLPGALPSILTGLRVAVSISLVVIVVTEMFIGTSSGLGRRIFRSYELFLLDEMYAAILVTGAIGYILNVIIQRVEIRIRHWGSSE